MSLLKAVIGSVSFSLFPNVRKDVKATKEYLKSIGAKDGKEIKTMKFPKEALDVLVNSSNSIRRHAKDLSLPWIDGQRLVPETIRERFTTELDAMIVEWYELIDSHFIGVGGAKYQEWIEKAMEMHNGNFNPALYPDWQSARATFKSKVRIEPVPSIDNFKSVVADGIVDKLKSDYEQLTQERVKAAVGDLFSRILDPVQHMAKTLADPDARIFDSMITNIGSAIDIADSLNITGHPAIPALISRIRRDLINVNPNLLRSSVAAKEKARAAAESIFQEWSSERVVEE